MSKSKVWTYFEEIADSFDVICKLCQQRLKRSASDQGTKSMWNHLKYKHKEQYKLLKPDEERKPKNESLDPFIIKKNEERMKAEESLSRIMIRRNCAFSFFNDEDLQMLYSKAYPNLKPHNGDYYAKIVVPRMAKNIQEKIKSQIGECYYAITSDGWSDPSTTPSFQSVTIHSCNKDFKRMDFVLAASPMEDKHTAENIANKIEENLAENGFKLEKLACLVRDNAANMAKSAKLLEIESFQCVNHFLHLVVCDLLKDPRLDEFLKKIRHWVKECRTKNGNAIFSQKQEKLGFKVTKLILSVPTRWNSTFAMMNTFWKQRKVILALEFDRQQEEWPPRAKKQKIEQLSADLPKISGADFTFMAHICSILQIFDDETKKFSNEISTASTIIPTLKKIRDFLIALRPDPSVQFIAESLTKSINDRVSSLAKNDILHLATLLDPRWAYDETIWAKRNWVTIENQLKEFAKQIALKNVDESNIELSEKMPEHSENSNPEMNFEETISSDESLQHYDIYADPKSPISNPTAISGELDAELDSKIKSQLAIYASIKRPPKDDNIFDWWRQHSPKFPELGELAQIFLSIPATSIASERLFSKTGLLYANTLRNRLSGKMAERILIIKAHLKKKLKLGPATESEESDLSEEEFEDEED